MLKQLGNSWALANRPKAAGSFEKPKSEKAVTVRGEEVSQKGGPQGGQGNLEKVGGEGEWTSKVGMGWRRDADTEVEEGRSLWKALEAGLRHQGCQR